MSVGNWLLGWVLTGLMVGVGIVHGWWALALGGVVFGLFWWFLPDWLPNNHQDPPEDIR